MGIPLGNKMGINTKKIVHTENEDDNEADKSEENDSA
jgi:hypothetical protein